MIESAVRTRRWTRVEYDRLIALGIIQEDERLELLAGELVLHDRQSPGHAYAIEAVGEALRHAIGPGSHLRTLSPIALDGESEPEPDLSVDAGAQYGWAYRVPLTLRADEHVTPLAAPSARIPVADLLP